jgi:hypothetical protein
VSETTAEKYQRFAVEHLEQANECEPGYWQNFHYRQAAEWEEAAEKAAAGEGSRK